MPVTVAGIEAELVVRIGPILRRVGLDGTTVDGTNPSLAGPIRHAVRAVGVSSGDPAEVADEDEETVLDLVELMALGLCWGNWPEVDQQAGEERQDLSQLADRIERRIKELKAALGALADPASAAKVAGATVAGLITRGQCYPPARNHWYRDGYGRRYYIL
jgi:hypothetical protein